VRGGELSLSLTGSSGGEIMEEDIVFKVDELQSMYDKLADEHNRISFQLRDAYDELNRIRPVYKKLYRNPFYWLIRPFDNELEGRTVMKCKTCGGVFWGGSHDEFTAHKGHKYSAARETGVIDYFLLRLGLK
jgi:hypothetical protein